MKSSLTIRTFALSSIWLFFPAREIEKERNFEIIIAEIEI